MSLSLFPIELMLGWSEGVPAIALRRLSQCLVLVYYSEWKNVPYYLTKVLFIVFSSWAWILVGWISC